MSSQESSHDPQYNESQEIKSPSPTIVILSEAGKPIFTHNSSKEDEEKIIIACGCIQTLQTTCTLIDDDPENDTLENRSKNTSKPSSISSIVAGNLKIVIFSPGALTFVAILESESDEIAQTTTEVYLRLQLEYLYLQVIFTLTKQAQHILKQNPGFDLRCMLGSTESTMRNIIEESYGKHNECFLASGIKVLSPLSYKLRVELGNALSTLCSRKNSGVLFALVLVDGQYFVTVVQPLREFHLYNSDLQLIRNFLNSSIQSQISNEIWFPLCLPRFNDSGFLHAYHCSLHDLTHLSLLFISANNTTEQFNLLRSLANELKDKLNINSNKETVKKKNNVNESNLTNAEQEASVHHIKKSKEHAEKSSENLSPENKNKGTQNPRLIQSILDAPNKLKSILKNYCELANALHFMFRFDVCVQSSSDNPSALSTYGVDFDYADRILTQTISPPANKPFDTEIAMRRLWNIYQRLSLRLRLGSSSVESTISAYTGIGNILNSRFNGAGDGYSNNGEDQPIQNDCLAVHLMEAPPTLHGVTYVFDGTELYIGLNGAFFELYAVLPGNISPKIGCQLCTKLVRKLMNDSKKLFILNPPTFHI